VKQPYLRTQHGSGRAFFASGGGLSNDTKVATAKTLEDMEHAPLQPQRANPIGSAGFFGRTGGLNHNKKHQKPFFSSHHD